MVSSRTGAVGYSQQLDRTRRFNRWGLYQKDAPNGGPAAPPPPAGPKSTNANNDKIRKATQPIVALTRGGDSAQAIPPAFESSATRPGSYNQRIPRTTTNECGKKRKSHKKKTQKNKKKKNNEEEKPKKKKKSKK